MAQQRVQIPTTNNKRPGDTRDRMLHGHHTNTNNKNPLNPGVIRILITPLERFLVH